MASESPLVAAVREADTAHRHLSVEGTTEAWAACFHQALTRAGYILVKCAPMLREILEAAGGQREMSVGFVMSERGVELDRTVNLADRVAQKRTEIIQQLPPDSALRTNWGTTKAVCPCGKAESEPGEHPGICRHCGGFITDEPVFFPIVRDATDDEQREALERARAGTRWGTPASDAVDLLQLREAAIAVMNWLDYISGDYVDEADTPLAPLSKAKAKELATQLRVAMAAGQRWRKQAKAEYSPGQAERRITAHRVLDVKIHPPYFQAVMDGDKTFEVRLNDRDYRVGDRLKLREWTPPQEGKVTGYTGRQVQRTVTYILTESPGLALDYVVLGLGLL